MKIGYYQGSVDHIAFVLTQSSEQMVVNIFSMKTQSLVILYIHSATKELYNRVQGAVFGTCPRCNHDAVM